MRKASAVLRFALTGVPLWSVMLLLRIPLYLVGAALIGWQSKYVEVRPSRYFPTRRLLQFRARWMFIFGNEEDGVDGLRGGDPAQDWWADKTEECSLRGRIFVWSALRNPLNNLRYLPLLSPPFAPARIHFVGLDHEMRDGESGWFYIWQGPYSGLRIEYRGLRFWIGWKFKPDDVKGIARDDTRQPRADFVLQIKRVA